MDPQTMAMLQAYQQQFGPQSHYGVAAQQPVATPQSISPQLAMAFAQALRRRQMNKLQPVQVTAQKIPVPNQGVTTSAPPIGAQDASSAIATE